MLHCLRDWDVIFFIFYGIALQRNTHTTAEAQLVVAHTRTRPDTDTHKNGRNLNRLFRIDDDKPNNKKSNLERKIDLLFVNSPCRCQLTDNHFSFAFSSRYYTHYVTRTKIPADQRKYKKNKKETIEMNKRKNGTLLRCRRSNFPFGWQFLISKKYNVSPARSTSCRARRASNQSCPPLTRNCHRARPAASALEKEKIDSFGGKKRNNISYSWLWLLLLAEKWIFFFLRSTQRLSVCLSHFPRQDGHRWPSLTQTVSTWHSHHKSHEKWTTDSRKKRQRAIQEQPGGETLAAADLSLKISFSLSLSVYN